MTLLIALFALATVQDDTVVKDLQAVLKSSDKKLRARVLHRIGSSAESDAPGRSVWRAWGAAVRWTRHQKKKLSDEEATALAAHAAAFPPTEGWDLKRLADAALAVAKEKSGAARLLACAYFDEMLSLPDPDSKTIQALSRELEVGQSTDDRWVDRDGELVWQIRGHIDAGRLEHGLTLERYQKAKAFSVQYNRAILAVHAAIENPDAFPAAYKAWQAARKGCPVKDHGTTLMKTVKKMIKCARCEGVGTRDCLTCKGKGEVTKYCSQCSGAGKLLKGTSMRTGRPVIEDCSYCNARGTWIEKCAICDAGQSDCRMCKGPYEKPDLTAFWSTEACTPCGGSGTLFRDLRVPCPYCHGVGKFLIPADSKKARLPKAR